MKKCKLCCVGHITHDKVITPKASVHMSGGTAFYFGNALRGCKDVDFVLVTAVGEPDVPVVEEMREQGMDVVLLPSKHSVYFENIYGADPNKRTQRVLAKADPFSVEGMQGIKAEIYHLGSLLADDFSLEVIKYLSTQGLVSVDSQGFLREVRGTDVFAVDWAEKREMLRHIHFLKMNEDEAEVLTGTSDLREAAKILYDWGVKEPIITLGSFGSVVYDGESFYRIPAYIPDSEIMDVTGCGDTYMAGYLYRRSEGDSIEECGKFAAAMSTIKIKSMGCFHGTEQDVYNTIETAQSCLPEI